MRAGTLGGAITPTISPFGHHRRLFPGEVSVVVEKVKAIEIITEKMLFFGVNPFGFNRFLTASLRIQTKLSMHACPKRMSESYFLDLNVKTLRR